jgi:hypothetical protein
MARRVICRNTPAIVAAAVVIACRRAGDQVMAPSPPVSPLILSVAVSPNSGNVLSAVISARVRLADSVAIRYGTSPRLDSVTPAVAVGDDSTVVTVLGLAANTSYIFRVLAFGAGQTLSSDPLSLTTDSLPRDLPRYTASGTDPSPGYVVFAAGQYGLVIDNSGRVVWYRRFPGGPGLNFEAEPTGHYFARPTTPDSKNRHPWVEIDPFGNVVRLLGCARDLDPRFHDLIAESNGAYWIMCDEVRTMNLSAVGGVVNAQVMGTVIQHVSAVGDVLFEWSPFDHFDIMDLDPASRAGPTVNWTHGNSLDLDADGNLVVSFRSLNELTKIDTRTGAIIWRMGGARNQFTFDDAAQQPFSFQHALRITSPGHLLLLDNLGDPTSSRVERYEYDAMLHTARTIDSYRPDPPAICPTGGSAQNLAGGRTLVSFGPAGRVEEYDEFGHVVWRIDGNAGYVFRAQRIRSLYSPGVGSPR